MRRAGPPRPLRVYGLPVTGFDWEAVLQPLKSWGIAAYCIFTHCTAFWCSREVAYDNSLCGIRFLHSISDVGPIFPGWDGMTFLAPVLYSSASYCPATQIPSTSDPELTSGGFEVSIFLPNTHIDLMSFFKIAKIGARFPLKARFSFVRDLDVCKGCALLYGLVFIDLQVSDCGRKFHG